MSEELHLDAIEVLVVKELIEQAFNDGFDAPELVDLYQKIVDYMG